MTLFILSVFAAIGIFIAGTLYGKRIEQKTIARIITIETNFKHKLESDYERVASVITARVRRFL